MNIHNPQKVPFATLNPGERFLLKEEVGTPEIIGQCKVWDSLRTDWNFSLCSGNNESRTYKTNLPLPMSYNEPDYSDPEYQKTVEQAFMEGKRIQQRLHSGQWNKLDDRGICWNNSWSYRIHPDDIDKEIDWKTPEKQAEVRRMWAENPAMERDGLPIDNPDSEPWFKWNDPLNWDGMHFFYRPAQKPREKTQLELDTEGFTEWFESRDKVKEPHLDYIDLWHAACEYAREASRKGVA